MQADADAVFQLTALRARVESEDGDLAPAAGTEAFENLDGGGLAGAVGAEQSEYFAGVDLKVNALDGGEIAVVFGKRADFNECDVPSLTNPAVQIRWKALRISRVGYCSAMGRPCGQLIGHSVAASAASSHSILL